MAVLVEHCSNRSRVIAGTRKLEIKLCEEQSSILTTYYHTSQHIPDTYMSYQAASCLRIIYGGFQPHCLKEL